MPWATSPASFTTPPAMSWPHAHALGNRTSYSYDALNRPTQVQDPLGNVTSLIYDAIGNVAAQINGLGQRTSYSYAAVSDSWVVRLTRASPLCRRSRCKSIGRVSE